LSSSDSERTIRRFGVIRDDGAMIETQGHTVSPAAGYDEREEVDVDRAIATLRYPCHEARRSPSPAGRRD
jgi:hypothetical protein